MVTSPAPGVIDGLNRKPDAPIPPHVLTPTGVPYRSVGLAGPCPAPCKRHLMYVSAAHHIPRHAGGASVAPGDLVYCPSCDRCSVIGNDLGLTVCPEPTDAAGVKALQSCKRHGRDLAKPIRQVAPSPAASPAHPFHGVTTRAPKRTRDSERRDIA